MVVLTERQVAPHGRLPKHVRGSGARSLNTKPLFKLMVEKKASDLFLTSNAPVKIKIEGQIMPVNKQELTAETVRQAASTHDAEQIDHFDEGAGDRLRRSPSRGSGASASNVFHQRGNLAMVLRYITADMPRSTTLGLPAIAQGPGDAASAACCSWSARPAPASRRRSRR